jgi:hypothetical protein
VLLHPLLLHPLLLPSLLLHLNLHPRNTSALHALSATNGALRRR